MIVLTLLRLKYNLCIICYTLVCISILIWYHNYLLNVYFLDLDHITLQSNIASILAGDGVVLKENDLINIEIPEW